MNALLRCLCCGALVGSAGRASADPPTAPPIDVLGPAVAAAPSGAAQRAAWEQRRRAVRAAVEQAMGPLPSPDRPVPLDVRVVEDRVAGNVRLRKLSYCTDAADRRATAWLLAPRTAPTVRAPAALCLHQTVEIGKDEPAGLGGNPHLHYARELAERGYVTLAPDYPSFGEYAYEFAEARYASGSMKAIYDNVRAVDLLQTLDEVDPRRIAAIGHSLGGHNAIFTAFFEPRIGAVVSCCGFTRFHRYYGGKLAGWTSPRYMPRIAERYGNDPDRVPFDFPELIACLAPRPLLAVAPLGDDNFAVEGVRETIAGAGRAYALLGVAENLQAVYPDCDHDFPADERRQAYRFLDEHLGHEAPRSYE